MKGIFSIFLTLILSLVMSCGKGNPDNPILSPQGNNEAGNSSNNENPNTTLPIKPLVFTETIIEPNDISQYTGKYRWNNGQNYQTDLYINANGTIDKSGTFSSKKVQINGKIVYKFGGTNIKGYTGYPIYTIDFSEATDNNTKNIIVTKYETEEDYLKQLPSSKITLNPISYEKAN